MNIETMRPPGHGNNCHGHNTSIQAGGNGHWIGDSCGCDGFTNTPSSNIDGSIYILFLIGIILISIFKIK